MFVGCDIAYVYGSDNAGFSWLFNSVDGILGVCVGRGNDNGKFEKYQEMFENNDHVIFSKVKRSHYNLSSTKVRSRQIYLIRDDSDAVTENIVKYSTKSKIESANSVMVEKIAKIIRDRIPSSVNMRIVNLTEQKLLFRKDINITTPTISLDMHFQGDYQIGLTRVFNASGEQETPIGFASRNTLTSEENEVSIIPPGEYTLIEDDVASGATLDYIIGKLLHRGIVIKDILLMNRVVGENFFDVVDMRDFIIGSTQSGLTIRQSDGNLMKAPYCFPYVNLCSRAKLNENMNASYEIWKANLEYYNSVCPGLMISKLHPQFVRLMRGAGFSPYNTVESICELHMKLCKPTSK
jgi:hypothetical protein